MHFHFSKMHGLGNDFMVVDCITQNIFFSPDLIRRLADRHTGVGFDQLLVVEAPYDPESDFHYRIFNADGTEVEQCGNGSRCFVRYVLDHGLSTKNPLRVEVAHTILTLTSQPDDQVEVNVFSVSNGGQDMSVSKLYNQVEAPPTKTQSNKDADSKDVK